MRLTTIAFLLLPIVALSAPASEESADLDFSAGGGNSLPTVVVAAPHLSSVDLSDTGAATYSVSAADIDSLPAGTQTPITDVLTQLPSVAIDQNQQIHIRNTEGPQFQYQINGFLVPLDINTNPPFLSMLNSLFVDRLDLQVGVLPARYGYATGGVVDVQSKDGCRVPGGEVSLYGGQRSTFSPSIEYAACEGALSSYVSARATWSDTAFSSATPGPTPIHDEGQTAQALGFWTYAVAEETQLSLLLAATKSDNELPNAPGLAPAYTLAGLASVPSSADIDSRLNFRDYLLMGSIKSSTSSGLELQLGYTAHFISQEFFPDPVGELVFQGVASQAVHEDRDNALEGDLHYVSGAHTLGAGFYVGAYGVKNSDNSLVFPADANGLQTSSVPERVVTGSSATNVVSSVYLSDLWRLSPFMSLDLGLRGDDLTGYTHAQQLSPRVNLSFRPNSVAAFHAGFARYLQVPSFLGIAPTTQAAFAGTTAQGPAGVTLPIAEDDYEYDAGVVVNATEHLTLSLDSYYERTLHYLDTGQFGVIPIFAPFNYDHGHIWGTELAARYKVKDFIAYANFTVGKNWQQGVATGQFNFPAPELAYIDAHPILLDHQPIHGASAGLSYDLHPYVLSADALYSSGLATGFADTQTLPEVLQVNAGVQRSVLIPGFLPASIRVSVLNVLDRVNEIRSAEGIGIFQAAYGPRRTVYGELSFHF
jgi:TonB dependent receptor/TonB-dependent Receptor Plug Domain